MKDRTINKGLAIISGAFGLLFLPVCIVLERPHAAILSVWGIVFGALVHWANSTAPKEKNQC